MSIISVINQNRTFQSQHSVMNKSIEKHAEFASLLNKTINAKPEVTDPDLIMSISLNRNYDEISDQAHEYYQFALEIAKERIDPELEDERLREIQWYKEATIEIMDMPIEVEIEQDEINEALLFGSLGIDFLTYKEMGVRIDMLNLMEQDINSSQTLLTSDKEKLKSVLNERREVLELQREEMLAGTYLEQNTDHKGAIKKRFDTIDFKP
ncbi:hypothetical protein [Pseudoalteromonas luteoviolacea]|uniref:Uncharacterized protein n=1 Tax=Pseudoalteromonas luteoviolacea S4054 TaxID=1129367 RepID=A0A0F6AFF5_9GAMM|nr:hypothetical protein [Pseudoalteromonas luteoviolacea]AOT11187.1 hypothetical protein S4054249_25510 [Pseudoalteromonas luteoviolacea]AOT15649.1 hypothetical protein S40542_23000 [Pseudoalteromonas luteoviolacea]AOT21008.1 hypothetical protein S4054_25430 [Pseudoalteromonas luteoviolacea]KKE84536.1 hypothetical protein N479_08200 [Pseudoalteromonas luteoviolacea S4054]KZN71319.1 hypothetical protein N481_19220 [Pseudoalteromonas luteoviolacea S4047-1]